MKSRCDFVDVISVYCYCGMHNCALCVYYDHCGLDTDIMEEREMMLYSDGEV